MCSRCLMGAVHWRRRHRSSEEREVACRYVEQWRHLGYCVQLHRWQLRFCCEDFSQIRFLWLTYNGCWLVVHIYPCIAEAIHRFHCILLILINVLFLPSLCIIITVVVSLHSDFVNVSHPSKLLIDGVCVFVYS